MTADSAALQDQHKAPNEEGVYTNLNDNILDGLRHTGYPTKDDQPGGLHGYGLDMQWRR